MTKTLLILSGVLAATQVVFADLRITEWMYSGSDGEFIEVTNLGDRPVDLSGWSLDDDRGEPGHFLLDAGGTLAPGQSAIITEAGPKEFRAAWSLPGEVVVIGDLGNPDGKNIGREDAIYLFDAEGVLVDRLTYGDTIIPGCPRTKGASAMPSSPDVLGTDQAGLWILAEIDDAAGTVVSTGGDIGNPGRYESGR